MATFEARVEGITGLAIGSSGTTPTQDELTEFLKDGVLEVQNIQLGLKPQDAYLFVRASSESDSQANITIDSGKIISVVREAGTDVDWREAGLVKQGAQSRVTDKESLDYASVYNPVYMVSEDGTVFVFPAPASGGANSYKVYYVNGTPTDQTNGVSLTYAHIDIKYFPEDKVHLVILYAAIKSIEAKIAEFAIDEEDEILVQALQPLLISFKNQWQTAFGANTPQGGEQ